MLKVTCLISILLQLCCGQAPTSQIDNLDSGMAIWQGPLSVSEPYPPSETFEPKAQKDLFKQIKLAKQKRAKHFDEKVVPIFVITCDRISVLIKSLLSYYVQIKSPIEIIIHDNNTTYPPTRDFLDRLEMAGIRVVRSTSDVVNDYSLSNINVTIQDWLRDHDSDYYVVTDPDIEIEKGPGDILKVFEHLLRENPYINVVGPMLRRDDLPDYYPLKSLVQTQQQEVYARDPITSSVFEDTVLNLQPGFIDTAFGMYRRNFSFHNYNRAIQTYAPYQARHLDWYLDPSNLTPDQIYYKQKNSPVGHWSSTWLPR